jgi:hypothetical protein
MRDDIFSSRISQSHLYRISIEKLPFSGNLTPSGSGIFTTCPEPGTVATESPSLFSMVDSLKVTVNKIIMAVANRVVSEPWRKTQKLQVAGLFWRIQPIILRQRRTLMTRDGKC